MLEKITNLNLMTYYTIFAMCKTKLHNNLISGLKNVYKESLKEKLCNSKVAVTV
jgi:hypothetical protein